MKAAIGVAVLAVLVGFLGPFVYIHFIEGPAPAKLELPSSSASTTTTFTQGSDTISSSFEGTWNVGSGSTAGYRVQEVLVGQEHDHGRPHEQDLGVPDHRWFHGDQRNVHRQHGHRRERSEPAQRGASSARSWM